MGGKNPSNSNLTPSAHGGEAEHGGTGGAHPSHSPRSAHSTHSPHAAQFSHSARLDCAHFGACGSCEFAGYVQSLAQKVAGVRRDFGEFWCGEIDVFANAPRGFRSRAEFRVWHDETGAHWAMSSRKCGAAGANSNSRGGADGAKSGELCADGAGGAKNADFCAAEEFGAAKSALSKSPAVVKIASCEIVAPRIAEIMPPLLAQINASSALSQKLFGAEFFSTRGGDFDWDFGADFDENGTENGADFGEKNEQNAGKTAQNFAPNSNLDGGAAQNFAQNVAQNSREIPAQNSREIPAQLQPQNLAANPAQTPQNSHSGSLLVVLLYHKNVEEIVGELAALAEFLRARFGASLAAQSRGRRLAFGGERLRSVVRVGSRAFGYEFGAGAFSQPSEAMNERMVGWLCANLAPLRAGGCGGENADGAAGGVNSNLVLDNSQIRPNGSNSNLRRADGGESADENRGENVLNLNLDCAGNGESADGWRSGRSGKNVGENLGDNLIENAGVNHSATAPADLLELYCGHGNFTIPLARNFTRVLANEVSKSSVENARKNAVRNGADNVTIARMSSEELIDALEKKREFFRLRGVVLDDFAFAAALVDPPRAGCDSRVLDFIARIEQIAYISCNPATLRRDLGVLGRTHEVVRFAVFDQFAYTRHVECGVILRRRGG